MIHLKNITCHSDCGTIFTAPKQINEITHEHLEFCIQQGYEYKEAILKQDGNDLVLCCPKCGKEGYRIRGGWVDGLN